MVAADRQVKVVAGKKGSMALYLVIQNKSFVPDKSILSSNCYKNRICLDLIK